MSVNNSFRILALAGGGVRGLFQAHFLRHLENEVGQPLNNVFDMCIGTSIGSVSAAAASLGIPTIDALSIYDETSSRVFGRSPIATKFAAIFRKGPLFDRKYLDSSISKFFSGRTFSDCRTGFVCTAGELSTFNHRIFSSFDVSSAQKNMLISDAVLSSCSAPIFFKPFLKEDTQEYFVDGGLWANSPAFIGVNIANRQLGVPLAHIELVSIGTGSAPKGTLERFSAGRRALSLKSMINVIEMYSDTQMDFFDNTTQGLIKIANLVQVNPPLATHISLSDHKSAKEILPALAASEFTRAWRSKRELFEPKERYRNTALGSAGDLEEMIKISGLSKIMPSRKYYKLFREGSGDIETYLSEARHSIEMVSISLSTGLGFEKITRVFERKLKDVSDFTIVVSLLDPDYPHLMETVTSSVSQEHYLKTSLQFSNEIKRGIETLRAVRNSWPHDLRKRFDIRTHRALPQGSAIILDRGHDRSVIQIETKPYKAPLVDSYAIEVRPAGPDSLYFTFLNAYGALLEDGTSVGDLLD